MKTTHLLLTTLCILLGTANVALAQRVWMEPYSGTRMSASDKVKIYLDKQSSSFWDQGPQGVFLHAGVSTSGPTGTDWSYGNGAWTDLTANRKMTKEGNYWVMVITPRTYFNIPAGVTAYRIQLLCRNEYDPTQPGNKLDNGGANYFVTLDSETTTTGVVSFNPASPVDNQSMTLTFRAALGTTQSLVGASKVYFHAAAITSSAASTSWERTIGTWGADNGVGQMTAVAGQANTWQITFNPRTYFGVSNVNEDIYRMTFVFRNATGSVQEKNGTSDFLYNIDPGFYLSLNQPLGANMVMPLNTAVPIQANSPTAANFTVKVDGITVYTVNGVTSINYSRSFATAGTKQISITATNGSETKVKTGSVNIYGAVASLPLPSTTMRYGVNYYSNDATKATLVLHLPTQTKNVVHLLGDFNNWQVSETSKMNRTPEGDKWWITLTGLTSGKEYIFQYLIDGTIRVADPYTNKVSDPWNDQYITATVYPGLKPYPSTVTSGIASYLQTAKPAYNWQVTNFTAPSSNKLNVYELHVRDFTTEGTYKAIIPKLDYIANLGINCIHVMPVSEFEGNDSWGYNPNFYFAPDKAYGTSDDLKQLVDECHKRGIAIINDLVLNHAFGTNAMAQMYWDAVNNRPAANNPWFNPTSNYVDNTDAWWGSDFNHESGHTRAFVDTVTAHWMKEYKFDGFRFDFTKGFTNTLWYGSGNWGSDYDNARIYNLKRMVDAMRARKPGAIIVFEHLADKAENKVLADYGVLHWGGKAVTGKYEEAILGWNPADLRNSYSKYSDNDFAYDNLMSYMESHDEQRLAYHLKSYGRNFIKNSSVEQYKRLKLAAGINMLIPGPRMVWQFGELGYDISIDFNGRTGKKPTHWEYYDDPARKDIFNMYSLALKLRKKYNVMHKLTGYTLDQNNWVKQLRFQSADTNVVVMANYEAYNAADANNSGHAEYFDVPTGLAAGNYYEAVSGQVVNLGTTYRLYAGDIKIFSNYNLSIGCATLTSTLNFGNVKINTTSAKTLTLTNITNQILTVTGLTLPAGFTANWTSGTLALGASQNIIVTFAPTQAVSYSGNVSVNIKNPGITVKASTVTGNAAIVAVVPGTFTKSSAIKLILYAGNADNAGTTGLAGITDKIYMHSGVVTSGATGTTWTYVKGNWGLDNGVGLMTKTANTTDQWEINYTPSTYYGVPSATAVYRLAMVFRNFNGSRLGKGVGATDIFVNVSQTGSRIEDISVESVQVSNFYKKASDCCR